MGLVLAFLPVSPAAAQNYICPAGPGPGERQVGTTGGGNGVAPAPVCTRDGPPPPPPVQMRAINNYYAAAWHKDARDAWIAAGYHSKQRAEAAALQACNRVMGGGCTVGHSNVNGAVAIARGTTGELYSAGDAKKAGAQKRVLEYCRTQNDECVLINTVTAGPGSAAVNASVRENPEIFGPQGEPRRQYGALAWIDSSRLNGREWTGDIWVVGGRPSWDKARADVLALCEADMPGACSATMGGSDVFVAFADRDGKSVSISSGADVELAKKRAMAECAKFSRKCRHAVTIDLARNESYRFDPQAEGKPYFSAQAWIKGDVAPWQNSVWSVGGAQDWDAAKQAALTACQKETRLECVVASSSFNSKVALYIDQNSYIRISYMARNDDPAAYVARKCAEAKVTCRLIKVVDARVALTERVEVK